MRTPVPRLGVLQTVCGILALLGCSLASAEVSVAFDPGTGRVLSLPVMIITDDPDPVPNVWEPYHDPSPGQSLLNPGGQAAGDGRVSSLIHPVTGEALVAWAKHEPQSFDIVLSRFAGGSWLAPVPVAAGPENELDPVLLVEPGTGQLHLIYWVDGALPRVMLRTAPADASVWSAPLQVSAPGDQGRRPGAVFHQGQLRVAYEWVGGGFPATPVMIALATYDGSAFQSTMVAQTHYAEGSWPGVHSKQNRLWVDWIDAEGELAFSQSSSTGWQPVNIETYATQFDLEFHARGRIAAHLAP